MIENVSVLWAFLAGVLSFLSPCVLPLVPPYLAYLAGASLQQHAGPQPARVARRGTLAAAVLFVAGFATVFVALGASASLLGSLLRAYAHALSMIAGVVIIAMGLHFLGVTPLALLSREKRVTIPRPVGLLGAYVMGLAFAFGWTPCIGPILGAILAVAASEATVAKGATLLAIYSAGLGVPFVAAAFAAEPFAAFAARFRRHVAKVEKATGAALVLTGIAFLAGWISQASYWLLETFPVFQSFG